MSSNPIDIVPVGAAGEGGGPQVVLLPSTANEDPLPPEPPKLAAVEQEEVSPPEGNDWDHFTQHQQFTDWLAENTDVQPPLNEWNGMTIVKKKAWLDENVR